MGSVGAPNEAHNWRFPAFEQKGDHPVVCISWPDAMAFCEWLSKRDGRTYRLPTEAEWEYACRAGTTTAYSFGDDESDVKGYGWYAGNSRGTTHPVGAKRPNPWGLFDLHGNVAEWCMDWYGTYPRSTLTDPSGPDRGSGRIIRGGSWADDLHGEHEAFNLRSASRYYIYFPRIKLNWVGMRVVAEVELD